MTNNVATWSPEDNNITMTANAITHVKQQITKEGAGIGIRLGLKKTGCSGLSYVVEIVDKTNPDDKVYTITKDICVAVSPKHLLYLQGTEIDYIKEGLNHKYKFANPNEKGSCGCGESFNI